MSQRQIIKACAAVALVAGIPAAAVAQDNTAGTTVADPSLNATADPMANDLGVTTTTDPMLTDPPAAPVEREDNDFPWGLLGLLGLAGLMGRKRNDDHVRDDHNRDADKRM
jgi:hypothetical protein